MVRGEASCESCECRVSVRSGGASHSFNISYYIVTLIITIVGENYMIYITLYQS